MVTSEDLPAKLLEVLFDGRAEADADVAAQAKNVFEQRNRG
jgi:hypothetical protein